MGPTAATIRTSSPSKRSCALNVLPTATAERTRSKPVTFKSVVTFEDLGGKTRLTLKGTFPSAAERARVITEYGADKGMVQTLSRLAEHVGEQLSKRIILT
jgi:hypothetical protein